MKRFTLIILAVILVFSLCACGVSSTIDSLNSEIDTFNSTVSNITSSTTSSIEEKEPLRTNFALNEAFTSTTEKIIFTQYEDNWTEYSKYSAPKEGFKIIRVYVEFKNISSTAEHYIYSGSFECYADDQVCDSYIFADDSLQAGTISAGRGTKGWIYYEVPVNATSIEIEYESWMDYSSANIVFKIQ